MLRHTSVLSRCALTLMFCAILAGCGKEEGPTYATVKGKVMLDGKVVQSGSITFVPEEGTEGGTSYSEIGKDGSYELEGPSGKGVVIGTHKVLLHCPQEGSGPDTGENPLEGTPPCKIPRRYGLENTSGITKTVKEGENDIPIALTTKRKKK